MLIVIPVPMLGGEGLEVLPAVARVVLSGVVFERARRV
jgi:hypothetical protein